MKRIQLKCTQQGFALIAAIVLVVVLAAMAGFVASMVGGQSAGQQLERMSRVADLAAQTGVEWGAYQVMRVPPPPAAAPDCPPDTTLTLPGSLGAVPVTVTCTLAVTSEAGVPVSVYRITATAVSANGVVSSPDYVERTKTAVFSR